jgi:glycosyltransferase involved in cell wall biosynthesis
LKTPGRVLYSLEAKRKFTKLLKDFKPDIIHCHNIYHHLSPSILTAAKKQGVPVIMHLHDYKLICPNHMLFTQGHYCEACRPNKYRACLSNECVKNSYSGSALATLEMYLHHNILKIYERDVALFIAPSLFMKNTAVSFGQDPRQIEVIYNPHNLNGSDSQDKNTENEVKEDNYYLYFGRLGEEKGLAILIKAAAKSGQKISIIGDGPEEKALKELSLNLNAPVEFLGFKNQKELIGIIKRSRAIIIPSIWAENMPLSLLEALSLNKVVIASNIGGMPEVVKDNENGLLFEAGNSDELAAKIDYLNGLEPDKLLLLEKRAGETAKLFSTDKNLESIISIYKRLTKTAAE